MFGGDQVRGSFVERQSAAHDFRAAGVENAQVHRDEQPLVRIDHHGVGFGRAVENVAMFFEQSRGSAVCGVDVQPQIVALRDRSDVFQGIDARRRRGAESRDYAERLLSVRDVLLDRGFQGIGAHAEFFVGGDVADVFAADADANAYLKSISVYWEILPPGERSEMLTHILAKFREPTKELREKLLDRYRVLEKLGPVAYISGTSGFQRYFGAQFADNLVVFENLEYGNAIYVMFDNWEELSKLSRIELLKNRPGFGFERIVHRAGWKDALKKLIKPRLAVAQHDMVMH